jgi:hypothetical protein
MVSNRDTPSNADPKAADLWHLFKLACQKYVKPTQQLCLDLAAGKLDEKELSERRGKIRRSPEIDESDDKYYWLGQVFIKRQDSSTLLDPLTDNVLYPWVEIADDFHAKLKEASNPTDFNRVREIANEFKTEFRKLNVQELKADVVSACELLREQHSGDEAELSIPQASAPAPAPDDARRGKVDVPIIRRDAQGATMEWKGTRARVDFQTADAFDAMIQANGQPVGLGKIVRKPAQWLRNLHKLSSELAAIVARAAGNRGYRVTIFDPTSESV